MGAISFLGVPTTCTTHRYPSTEYLCRIYSGKKKTVAAKLNNSQKFETVTAQVNNSKIKN